MSTNKLQRSRQLAFDQQEGKCYYCGFRMRMHGANGPSRLLCTAEHLIPRGEGGSDAPSNIVAACIHCNQTRHRRKQPPPPDRYKAEVQRRVKRGRWLPHQVRQWATSTPVGHINPSGSAIYRP
jgi:5-methylcytosine-specific restriction endonuclease McrA